MNYRIRTWDTNNNVDFEIGNENNSNNIPCYLTNALKFELAYIPQNIKLNKNVSKSSINKMLLLFSILNNIK